MKFVAAGMNPMDLKRGIDKAVIAVGPGAPLDNGDVRALGVKKGDRVLFGKYAGTEVKLDGSDYVILKEDDVLAVLK